MQLTVCDGDKIANVQLDDHCPVENMVALVMMDLARDDHHDAASVRLLKNGVDVLTADRTKTLVQCGLADGDLLLYKYGAATAKRATAVAPGALTASAGAAAAMAGPSSSSTPIAWEAKNDGLDAARKKMAELLGQSMDVINKKHLLPQMMTKEQREEFDCRDLFQKMNNPRTKRQFLNLCPALHDQFVKNPTDYEGFKRIYVPFMAEERRKVDMMHDPTSAEGQKLVMETMHIQRCDQLYRDAMEKMPEAFFPIHMLYIKLVVNGVPTYAFVDSGAQISLMALSFAKKTGLEHLMDTRYRGRIQGIGGADKTEGTIYSAEFVIGDAKFDAKVTVTNDKFDVLIGLDFMRRHRCCIDLGKNRLSFTETTYAEFLSDAEIKEWQKDRDDHIHHSFKLDEAKVAELVGMGFNKADAEKALTSCVNDVTDAIHHLYSEAEQDQEDVAAADAAAADGSSKMEH